MTFIVLFMSAVWIQPPLPRFLQRQQQNHNIKFRGQLFILNKLVRIDHMFFFFLHFILFDIIPFITTLIDISFFLLLLLILFFVFLYFFFLSLNLDQLTLFYMCINCFFFFCGHDQINHFKRLSLILEWLHFMRTVNL